MYNYRSTISLKVNLPGVLRGKHLGVKCLVDAVCYSDAKSVRIRIVCGPHLPTFKLNTKIYRANLHIHSECGKIWTRKAPNTDNFYAVFSAHAV